VSVYKLQANGSFSIFCHCRYKDFSLLYQQVW